MVAARSMAAVEAEKTARPGGRASAFWAPSSMTSTPHSSMGVGTVVNDETVSVMMRTSGYLDFTSLAMSPRGLSTPVDVSLWTMVMASKPPTERAASTNSGVMG